MTAISFEQSLPAKPEIGPIWCLVYAGKLPKYIQVMEVFFQAGSASRTSVSTVNDSGAQLIVHPSGRSCTETSEGRIRSGSSESFCSSGPAALRTDVESELTL